MKRTSILTLLALFAATLTQQGGAWAQGSGNGDDWGQIQTASSKWTHITAGSTTGFELKDDYYYVSENLTFTNTSGGAGQGSGMYVQAGREVHLYIPANVTLTAIGADADGIQGAGAGILLPAGTTLHILGEGTLVAHGGNAANGQDGMHGTNAHKDGDDDPATWILGESIYGGVGGWGGYGGGGAGAGIGTAGGNGGAGGQQILEGDDNQPQTEAEDDEGDQPEDAPGVEGNPGQAGTSAVATMGTLNIQSTVTTDIAGGAKGTGGAAGHPGTPFTDGGEVEVTDIEIKWVSGFPVPIPNIELSSMKAAAGGGGGGGGAGGGHAEAIGTGGPGGGGGGSGACGNICIHNSWTNDDFAYVEAGGGKGGLGIDSNNGTEGYKSFFEGKPSAFDDETDIKDGGAGGVTATASASKSPGEATAPTFNVQYFTVAVTPTKTEDTYSVGSSTTITLPSLSGGNHDYKWILSIHGHAAGNTTSHCAAPNGDVYEPGATVNLSNIYGAIEFCAVYVGCEVDCEAILNNWPATAWANYVAGPYAVVKLTNRKFYRDGYWNTLTLPFGLSADKLANSCLAGADVRYFKNASWDAGNQRLTINFSSSNENHIEAGVPCIIRWGEPGNAPEDVISDPIFTNVTVAIQSQEDLDAINNSYETTSGGVRFEGQIAPCQVPANTTNAETKALLLGANNNLYKPNKKTWVHATHAYFDHYWNDYISMASELVIDFGDGEQTTTKIDDIKVDDNRRTIDLDGIFNLNGQRLFAPRKGLNIINGKKVVIK